MEDMLYKFYCHILICIVALNKLDSHILIQVLCHCGKLSDNNFDFTSEIQSINTFRINIFL